jgi:hypothetical protein
MRGITGDVAKRPNSLLTDVIVGRRKKAAENRDRTLLDNYTSVLGRAGGDVGQGPSSFKLQTNKRSFVSERAKVR